MPWADHGAQLGTSLKRPGNGQLAKCPRVQLPALTAMTSSARAASAIPLRGWHSQHGATRRRDGNRRTIESARTASMAKAQLNRAPRSLARRVLVWLAIPLRTALKESGLPIGAARALGDDAERAPTARPIPLRSAGLDPVAAQAWQITDELRGRLNQHALSRKVFSQLAVLEHEFKRSGDRCLESLPLELLETALEQLVFVMGRAPGEWATLRTKMAETILARAPKPGAFGGSPALSVFNTPDSLHIADATESAFLHAEQEWAQRGSLEHRVLGCMSDKDA